MSPVLQQIIVLLIVGFVIARVAWVLFGKYFAPKLAQTLLNRGNVKQAMWLRKCFKIYFSHDRNCCN